MIGHHQEIQDRLHQEVVTQVKDSVNAVDDATRGEKVNGKDIQGKDDDLTSSLAYDVTKNKLPLLESVIKESLRLFPPVPVIARQIKQEVRLPRPFMDERVESQDERTEGQPKDYVIPADTCLAIDIYRMHRDPRAFQDPNAFNPNRFMKHDGRPEGDVFMPFSAGLRSCIGSKLALMEMRIILSHILTTFSIESVTPINKLNLSQEIVLKPNNPDITIIFRERKTDNKRFSL